MTPCFDVSHTVNLIDDLFTLRVDLSLRLADPGTGRSWVFPFRFDTGADISVIPDSFLARVPFPLNEWQPGLTFRTASGNPMRSRRARGVEYEFPRLPGIRFKTDFAVTGDLTKPYGLLAWRDLALDFDVRTPVLPRLTSAGIIALGLPGVLRFCLRPDRYPDRVG